jgi:hypothetical protein
MIPSRRVAWLLAGVPLLLIVAHIRPAQRTSVAASDSGSKAWVGHYQEVEEYLRTAECVQLEALKRPDRMEGPPAVVRCALRPGGPVSRMAWMSRPPGVYRGFRESYTFNIAAYEVDKLLRLDMVPPTVERELQGQKGAATFWVENVTDLNKNATPEAAERARWEKQLARMSAFDSLIGNSDRNLGNMLRDASWNLILIDHSRAFATGTELRPGLTRVDEELWGRIEALTRRQLDTALGAWLDADQIAAIIERREKMRSATGRQRNR